MAFPQDAVLLKDSRVWVGGYDFSGSLNQVALAAGKAELANSRLGDVAECFEQGLEQISFSMNGFMDYSAAGVDALLYPRIKTDTTSWPLTICPPYATAAAPGADGNIGYTIVGKQYSVETGAAHGELLPYACKTNPSSTANGAALYRQTVILPKTSVSATTTGTGYQLGAVTATQKLVATFHFFSETGGGSWVLTIESDDNSGFTSATTRMTFTAATAITRQVVELNGAVTDDYWRAVLTKTGGTSCIPAALLSIEPL